VSDPGFEYEVPTAVRAGAWANDVHVDHGLEDVTIDVVRLEPRDPTKAFVVARVMLSPSCTLGLRHELRGGFA
jgi:hypothetical protein